MKKTITILLTFACMITALQTKAQLKHNIKVDLTAMALKQFRVNYEVGLTEKDAIGIHIGRGLPISSSWMANTDGVSAKYESSITLEKAELVNHYFGLQYKRFLGNKTEYPKGFYVAAMIQSSTHKTDLSIKYLDTISFEDYSKLDEVEREFAQKINGSSDYEFQATGISEGKISRFGLGIDVGYQWYIGDRISIDCTILGLNFEYLNAEITLAAQSKNYHADYTDWSDDITSGTKDVFLLGERLNVDVQTDRVRLTLPAYVVTPYTGVKIGVVF